jgi:general secretion pathway protein L
MSILIIQLPTRSHQASDPAAAEAVPAGTGPKEYSYVLSVDGLSVARQGRCVANMLPKADSVVAVMPPTDLSWHRVNVPKAPVARMRAALAGVLEEALLDDPEEVHLALAPQAKIGQSAWVVACDHTWLTGQLMALEKAKFRVDRVVPAVAPDEPPTAYFHEAHASPSDEAESGSGVLLTWTSDAGVSTWPLAGSLARVLLPDPLPVQARFFATPPVASPAERWLGRAVTVQTQGEHLLVAARSLWNLLQFDLTPSSKGLHALSDKWRRVMGPQWRPARVGLAALVAVQLIGLNLWAWQQKQQVQQKRSELARILKQTHPQVGAVLDAPVQMQRETEALRAAAGQAGDGDLEALMGAVATAWPPEQPTASLQYDGAVLTLSPPEGWGPDELAQFSTRLGASGLEVEPQGDGRVSVRRAPRV